MRRPLADKRPLGPFAQVDNLGQKNNPNEELGIASFGLTEQEVRDIADGVGPPLFPQDFIGTEVRFVKPKRSGKIGNRNGEKSTVSVIRLPTNGIKISEFITELQNESDDVVRLVEA